MILLLQYLWALPMALVGLLLAAIWRGRNPRWEYGYLRFHIPRMWPRSIAGLTLGWVVFFRTARPHLRLQIHEGVHVQQCLLYGPFVLVLYPLASLLAWLSGGSFYRDNVFELAARRGAGSDE
mgnify:CR=1 FL=1